MDENGYSTIRVRKSAWTDLALICAKTGEPKTAIVARLARDELARLSCTHTYPGGQDVCALCGARRKDKD